MDDGISFQNIDIFKQIAIMQTKTDIRTETHGIIILTRGVGDEGESGEESCGDLELDNPNSLSNPLSKHHDSKYHYIT